MPTMRSAAAFVLSVFLLMIAGVPAVIAQAYPAAPVKVLVGYPPGGGSDLVARLMAQKLGEGLMQNFVVENRVGGSGIVAARSVATARPDGYTLLVAPSTQVITPALMRDLPYDVVHDFSPITLLAHGPYVLVVHPGVAAGSVTDLIAYAKANPGKLRWGLSNLGAGDHIAIEMFNPFPNVGVLLTLNKNWWKNKAQCIRLRI